MTARDTAIERRNLTTAQRVDIVLRSEELVKGIEKKAKARQQYGFKGNQHVKVASGPKDPDTKPERTATALGKIAGTSVCVYTGIGVGNAKGF